MKETIYITGHRNPDSDSICAAICYADLKRRRGIHAIPLRLGEISNETKFILDYFNMEVPDYKETIKPQISDIEIDPAYTVDKSLPMYKALNIIQDNLINQIQVVDENERLIGLVSLSNLTKAYMDIWDESILGRASTPIENIIETLSASIINLPETPRELSGRMTVYAMEPGDIKKEINKDDIVIIGSREDAQIDAINRDVSLIILSTGSTIKEEYVKEAKARNIAIIATEFDSFMVSRLLPLSAPIEYIMTKDNLVTFKKDEYLDEVSNTMVKSRYRSYPVVDDDMHVLGAVARFHLIKSNKKKLILVDHNERNQSIMDIDSAEILEIIDHHRVANIATNNPVFFRNEPVGSTATIISEMYFEMGIIPSREIAGLLSAAIISDTLLLRSPTTTEIDRQMLSRMSKIAGIEPEAFAKEMFKAGTSLDDKTSEDLLRGDVKLFVINGVKVRIAQVLTMDLDSLKNIKEDLIVDMKEELTTNKEDTFILVFTDILKETSKIIVVGSHRTEIEAAFGTAIEGEVLAEGILSRKKQVVPRVMEAIVSTL